MFNNGPAVFAHFSTEQEHLAALDGLDREDEPNVNKDVALYINVFSDEDNYAEVEDILDAS